jgi:hypothetical protein
MDGLQIENGSSIKKFIELIKEQQGDTTEITLQFRSAAVQFLYLIAEDHLLMRRIE